jgi:tetratricopeptide (TPR) repeat protein
MVNYVNQNASQQVNTRALYRVGGDLEMVRVLLSQGFPVIVEKGYEVNDLGWMGHYLLIIGYDDTLQIVYTYDSYLGHGNTQGLQETYADIEHFWKHFNYTFLVLYEPEREQQLLSLLGHRADPISAAQGALEVARQQASANPNDNWAWFNLGSSYSMLGDHERAAQGFDQAFLLGMPWRTLWYRFEPYTTYFALGRYDDILAHAQATESTTVYVEETFFYRGAVLAAQGDTQGAINQFNRALSYNANFQPAQVAIQSLQNGTFSAQMVLTVGLGG